MEYLQNYILFQLSSERGKTIVGVNHRCKGMELETINKILFHPPVNQQEQMQLIEDALIICCGFENSIIEKWRS